MRNSRSLIGIILVLVVAFGFSLTTQAQDTINLGDTITATKSDEPVEYLVDISAGTVVMISAVSDAFDTELALNDAAGNEIASDSDSGEGFNALLVLVIPEDGTYTVVVDSWLASSGEFTLNISAPPVVTFAYGDTAEIPFENENLKFFIFEGSEGDVLNIFGNSGEADMDTRFTLFGPDNQELTYDDDGAARTDPAIVRTILPADGLYLVKVTTFFDELVTGILFVTIEETELLSLDEGPLTVTLGERFDYEVVRFKANANQRYRLTLTATGPGVDVEAAIGRDWDASSIDLDNALQGTLDFYATGTGLTDIILRSWSYSDTTTVEISIEAVQ